MFKTSQIDGPASFAVPCFFEVDAVLCRIHPSGRDGFFIKGMIPILQSRVFRHPMTENLAKQAGHFFKKGLTGYDACCAALAREVKGVWLTFDAKAHACLEKDRISHILDKDLPIFDKLE